MITKQRCNNQDTATRLWVHECQRVFYDRLIDHNDQAWFKKLTCELLSRHLRSTLGEEELFGSPIIFCDFLRPAADVKQYEEAQSVSKVAQLLADRLDEYNSEFANTMDLVFFEDAVVHTFRRISRMLRQPRGNAMLVGVGGSGKQSLTRIASYTAGMECKQIEITRGYGINDFREDIKTFMIKTGIERTPMVFLFTDSQIVVEDMLEDINNMLNSGEIPNLFPADEKDRICNDMVPVCKQMGIPETRDNCWNQFIQNSRDNLHMVLGMSPVGDALRVRCRLFPSLINTCTIDWYMSWPKEALISVAERFLGNLELPDESYRTGLVEMCSVVHKSVEGLSVRFFNELLTEGLHDTKEFPRLDWALHWCTRKAPSEDRR